jgi:hypothetical protein
MEKLKNVQLKEEFEKMSEENLNDYEFLSDFIYNKVGIRLNKKTLKIYNYENMKCWGGLQCKQYPEELAKLLVFIYQNRFKIHSYCEIGVERGGTFFVIDSFLRAINPNMGKSLAIDTSDKIIRHNFQEYQNKHKDIEFIKINSVNFKPEREYDLCLVDGDHSYDGVKNDFELMKPFSKYIAIHDIKLEGEKNNVRKLWKEIEGNKTEFVNESNIFSEPIGIGLWKSNKKIDFEFRLFGDRQGGQHAIVDWLLYQFNGVTYRKNDALQRHDVLKMSEFPNMNQFKLWSKKVENNYISTFANYEDKTIDFVDAWGYSQHATKRYDIIVLRDPYNLFASKIYNWRANSPRRLKQFDKKIDIWKEKARKVLENKCCFINFNKWFVDIEYRKEILSYFPENVFTFTDEGKEDMPTRHGRSSFNGKEYHGKASQMNILYRYKDMLDDPLMKKIIADKEIKELSDQIFGKIIEN